MKTLKTIFSLLTIGIFLISCSGDDGTNGPEGPAGVDGIDGTNGIDGNPVVFFSDWALTGTTKSETFNGVLGSTFIISAPELTQEILNKGVVLIYMQSLSSGKFSNMPLPLIESTGSKVFIHNFWPELGQITIYKFLLDGTTPTPVTASLKWRYVLIPGGTNVTGKKNVNKLDYSKMSYEQVCKLFNIAP
ncbi:hypothetical protein [Flavobacterium sp.]|uniref:hypothetical protein n=1 Tax=Flavobacterium sp. TaxID=239 RepID=UPI00326762CC